MGRAFDRLVAFISCLHSVTPFVTTVTMQVFGQFFNS